MKIADNRKQLKRHIKRSIAANGFAILSVNPPKLTTASSVNYSYTVGLSQRGMPELFICGPIPNEVMGAILKNQANVWMREGANLAVREGIVRSSEPVKAMRSKCRMLITEEAVGEYCHELRQRGGKNLQIAQVCYPDAENRLPGEPGYDVRYRQDVIKVIQTPVEDLDPMADLGARGKTTEAEATQFMSDVLGGEARPEPERPTFPPEYVYTGSESPWNT